MLEPICAIPLTTPDDLARVRDLDYGLEPCHLDVTQWIREEAANHIKQGTRVWMYADGKTVLGYGSLGVSRWRYPEPGSKKVPVLIIPAVALAREFWKCPKDADRADRYSSQIMRHLLSEAEAWANRPEAIGLYIHPANEAAKKLYERFGFRLFHNTYSDPTTNVTYLGYVRAI